MKQRLLSFTMAIAFALAMTQVAFGQAPTTGSLTGTVSDPSGVVKGATISVQSLTGAEFTAQTSDSGAFVVPSLPAGLYTVTVTAQNYKKAVITDVKIDVGKPSSLNLQLEIGTPEETVTIVGGGGELLNTTNATVGTTIIGRQIVEQPQASRDALDLVTLMPGVQTTGRPRQSSVNGLPKGALNITIDGTNVQDNLIRSQDGFFTFVRPRIDTVDEVTVSTATPGAESSGTGAVQIKFVTRGGTNDFTGSVYWYHREPSLSANYWYNNATLAADPNTGKAPMLRVLLNQYGFRVGGPIRIPKLFDGRDKAFFFVNYEEYRLPEAQSRTRTILNTNIFGGPTPGNFSYVTSAGLTQTVNLFDAAAAFGVPGTLDPTISSLLGEIRGTTSQGSLLPVANAPNYQRFTFINPGGQERYFPTVRFDFNVGSRHHIENIWNYQRFTGKPVDFLNNSDPSFPGFPNHAGQDSHRWSNTTALRSTITSTLVNEARFGITGGISLFGSEVGPQQFANQGGFDLALSDSVNAVAVLTDATAANFPAQGAQGLFGNTSTRRNTPTKTFSDNVNWIRGNHSFNFGGEFTQINYFARDINQVVPNVFFGVAGGDPIEGLFFDPEVASVVFPGASATQLNEASQIYGLLTGRVVTVGRTAFLDEDGNYTLQGQQTSRFRQREFGFFAQDSWRMKPNFTLTYGVRWEPQQSPVSLNSVFAKTDLAGVFGVSAGRGLFNPGVSPGAKPAEYTVASPGEKFYKTDWNNFAPSIGFAYSPNWNNSFLGRLFGESGQSVIRAGYSMAFIREGMGAVTQPVQGHPGGTINLFNIAGVDYAPGTLLTDIGSIAPLPFPAQPTYPVVGNAFDFASPSAFDPNLKTGYVQSWTIGFQRELNKDTVFEARYVGTRGIKLWRRYNINEVNTIENGFANEFRLAQQNLVANKAAGRGNNFRYFGPGTGTSPLPTMLGFFTGDSAAVRDPNVAANYSSSAFASTTLVPLLVPGSNNVLGFANQLSVAGANAPSGIPFFLNGISAGIPANYFVANPDAMLVGAFLTDNGGHTWYDALTLEVRRRLSAGLLLQANYTFSKSMSDMYASSQSVTSSYLTMRDLSTSKRLSPFDIRHAFKVNWIYELPFGKGKQFLSGASNLVDKTLGGWEIHGTARVQSGRAFRFGNVQLVGMTADELQKAIEVRKQPNGIVTFLPDDIILNTRRAFNFSSTTANGYSTLGAPEGKFIAPPGYGGCLNRFIGECGFADLVLHGPRFVRVDASVVKRFNFSERMNLELRGEFLNAINNQNFFVGGSPATDTAQLTATTTTVPGGAYSGATFVQLPNGSAYPDVSTTNDPGGRLVQFVIRFNF